MTRQITAVAFVIGLMAGGPAEAQSPVSTGPTLTAQQLDKMATLAAQTKPNSPLSKKITGALGLTSADEELKLDQLGTRSESGDVRAFYRLHDGGYLLLLIPAHKGERFDSRFSFRLDKNFKLISGIVESGSPRQLKNVSTSEALPKLDSELKAWADVADHIVDAPDSKKGPAK